MAHPTQIGRYRIVSAIARGGMAIVYLADDPQVGRQVAVKVLSTNVEEPSRLEARFRREARTIAQLEHPAIVPVYDFGEEDEALYLVMRYMPGGSLAQRLRQQGAMSPVAASQVLERIGSALAEAHQAGVIHRDLKPGNILFDHTGRAYLSDFGIAKLREATLTATGAALGTPAYMSPEQVQGTKEVDYRSDIYALGIILFEMLSGQLPFKGETPIEQATARILEPVPDIRTVKALPDAWDVIIRRAMARDKAARYATVGAFVADVTAVANGGEPANALRPAAAAEAPAVVEPLAQTFSTVPISPTPAPPMAHEPHATPISTEDTFDRQARAIIPRPIRQSEGRPGGEVEAPARDWRLWVGGVGAVLLVSLLIFALRRGGDAQTPATTAVAAAVGVETAVLPTASATAAPIIPAGETLELRLAPGGDGLQWENGSEAGRVTAAGGVLYVVGQPLRLTNGATLSTVTLPDGAEIWLNGAADVRLLALANAGGAAATRLEIQDGGMVLVQASGAPVVVTNALGDAAVANGEGSLMGVVYAERPYRFQADCLAGSCGYTSGNEFDETLASGESFCIFEGCRVSGVVSAADFALWAPVSERAPTPTATLLPTQTPMPTRPPATATPTLAAAPRLVVTISSANVRSGPGTRYAVVGIVYADDVLDVLAHDGDREWYNVRLPDGTPGWVSASVVAFVDPALAGVVQPAATIPAPPQATSTPRSATRAATAVPTLPSSTGNTVTPAPPTVPPTDTPTPTMTASPTNTPSPTIPVPPTFTPPLPPGP